MLHSPHNTQLNMYGRGACKRGNDAIVNHIETEEEGDLGAARSDWLWLVVTRM